MSSIEDEIVTMKFDNKQFESGVATSMGTLEKLKSSLDFKGATGGLGEVDRAVKGFDFNPFHMGIEGVSKAWLAMSTVAITAISSITSKAIDAGLQIGKSLTIDPIKSGFSEYQTNINSIQTILANTGLEGRKGLDKVNAALDQMNTYADKTIYNFSEMAKNVGTFTAAGVDLDTATGAIKGIANLAALSGSNSQQASTAMYQLSQAIASGKVGLQDWNSVVNAGMGGRIFQQALARTAENMGQLEKGAAKLDDTTGRLTVRSTSFRDSISAKPGQTPWLTGEALVETLKQLSGEYTTAQLKAKGYSDAQIKEIQKLAETGVNAATKVKTLSGLMDTMKEAVGSGWARTFRIIFGDFSQAKNLFTGLSNYFGGFISQMSNSRNALLQSWSDLGGREELLGGLERGFKNIVRLLVPFKNAFRDVFPATTGKNLANISKGFHSFMEALKPNVKTMRSIRDIFGGIFSVFKIAFSIIGAVAKAFGLLFGIIDDGAGKGAGGLLSFLAMIGRSVTRFQEWVTSGDSLSNMLTDVAKVVRQLFSALKPLLPILQKVGSVIADMAKEGLDIAQGLLEGLLEGLDAGDIQAAVVEFANNIIQWIKDTLGIHSPSTVMVDVGVNIIEGIVQGILSSGDTLTRAFQTLFTGLAKGLGLALEGLGGLLKEALTNINLSDVLDIINTAIAGGFLIQFKNLTTSLSGISDSASGVLDQITGSLKTMQSKVKSEIIRNIALSVLALAGAAFILSRLDGKKLAISMGAIAGLMASLTLSMKVLMGGDMGAGTSVKDTAKKAVVLSTLGTAMVLFSTSILILAGAVAILGRMKPETITQGLEAVGAVVAGVIAATAILSRTGGGATILATAAALLILSASLTAFAGVIKIYSKLDTKMIAEGGGKAAAVIVGLGLAMRAFGPNAIGGSVGLVIASAALLILSKALEKIAAIENTSDAVWTIVGVLTALTLAALGLSAAEGGALSMLVISAAIIVLAKALEILSKIPGKDLFKALGIIVLALGAIGLAAYLLTPAIPLIAALGAAVLLVGQGMALAGVGVLAFAAALGILAVVGPAGFQAVYDGVMQMLSLLPEIGKAIGGFIVSIIQGFVEAAGPLTKAVGKLIGIIVDTFIANKPKIRKGFRALFDLFFDVIGDYSDRAIHAGIRFILQFLTGIEEATPRIAHKAANIIIAFMDAIETEYPRVKRRAIKFIGFLSGEIGSAIDGIKTYLTNKAKDIGWDIINGVLAAISAGKEWVMRKIHELADLMPKWLRDRLGIGSPSKVMRDEVGKWIVLGLVAGISDNTKHAEKASKDLANKSLDAMQATFKNSRKMAGNLSDVTPKITPILDLTELERGASQISGRLSGRHTLNAQFSRNQARDISSADRARLNRSDDFEFGNTYNFNQEIKSLEPINHVKVYRGTRSQIALFKEVTGK